MTDTSTGPHPLKRPLRYVMAGVYVLAGVMHFVMPDPYERIVPPRLPRPRALVFLSGVTEIALGVGLLVPRPRVRRWSAWGIIGLLAAVFPANVYMATGDIRLEGAPEWLQDHADLALYARLPLQGVLALWAWWYTQPDPDQQG